MIKLIIKGDPKTKKNNSQIIRYNNRPMVIPSASSIKYEKESIIQIKNQIPEDFEPIDFPVNVKTIFYRKELRTVDISNLFSAIHDILSRAGVLEDDNWRIIESVNGSKVRFDRDNPRTEITITKAKGETAVSYVEEMERKKEEEKLKIKQKKENEKNKIMKKSYELRKQGLTFKEIGNEIGYSGSTASKYVKKYEKDFIKKANS